MATPAVAPAIGTDPVVVPAETLRALAERLLQAVGTPAEAAAVVADGLVEANLAGHDSHGVLRLVSYLDGVRLGHVDPAARPAVISRRGAVTIVDAANGWGQPAMWLATEAATAAAKEVGLGAAVVRRSYHIGRVAPYVEAVARAGAIGLAMANAAPAVAPYGGRARVFGTNPIAWAVPRGEGKPPVCLDVATAAVAEGKLRVARAKGTTAPDNCLLDRDGQPTCDPAAFYAGGALLPFGGHKGSGFSLLAQLVGRGLAGHDPSRFAGPRGVNGPFILAIDVGFFGDPAVFVEEIEAQCAIVTASAPADGFDKVRLPGDPEIEERARRLEHGVPVPPATWADLQAAAARLGETL